jgi:hypothetical protein
MILLLAFGPYLRALLGRSTAVALENIAVRSHSPAAGGF